MKKYKTSEAIAMLEKNPKLKIKNQDGFEIYVGRLDYFNTSEQGFDGNIKINDQWELVQQPVDFLTAVKAYSEGKTIRCESDCGIYKYKMHSISGHLISVEGEEKNSAVTSTEILEGNWYIEEGEQND